MDAYDQIAAWYTSTRDPTSGADEIEAFARQLAPGSAVLDVGCGDGVPVSRLLHRAGLALTALDSSRAMVERYRANVPDVPVRHASVLDAEFDAGTFAGIVAWGVLFHLTLEDQADAFGRISTWLAPAGRLLFTSGGTRGSTIGAMDGVEFEYHSSDPEGYRRLLARSGLRLERHAVNAWGNHVYAAVKEG